MSYHDSVFNTHADTINEFIARFVGKTSVDINEYENSKIEIIFDKKQTVTVEVNNNIVQLPPDVGHYKLLVIACILTSKDIKMHDNQFITNGVLNDYAYHTMLTFAKGFTKKRKSKKLRKIKKKSKTFRHFA
jgi:hypothetical protein